MPPIYRFQRGEPIVIGRQVISGSPDGFTVSAALKRSSGQVVPRPDTPIAATFEVDFAPADDSQAARWIFTIPPTVSAELRPGYYAVDAAFALDGEIVEITDPAFITIAESVSG